MEKSAKANVKPVRQRTQYTCMATSLMMCLQALGVDTTEDEVNKVMGCRPMQGASWEDAIMTAQHYGVRANLCSPATLGQIKRWTDEGKPVMFAWNPEGRDWSHASVIFDVDDENVYVADPNIPNPEETVRVVPKGEFYKKWYEKAPRYLFRRPACFLDLEVTEDGRQVFANSEVQNMLIDIDEFKKSLTREASQSLSLREDYGSSEEDKTSRFEEGVPADPTVNMSEEDKKKWEAMNEKYKDKFKKKATRVRLSTLIPPNVWFEKKAARTPQGLYGTTKAVQKSCEMAIKNLVKKAQQICQKVYRKNSATLDFLNEHYQRFDSKPSLLLVESLKESLPKIAKKAKKKGLYGFSPKVYSMGNKAIVEVLEFAGDLAYTLSEKHSSKREMVLNFLTCHEDQTNCTASALLKACFPSQKTATESKKVAQKLEDGWLVWED